MSHSGRGETRFQDLMKGKEEAFDQLLAKTTERPPKVDEDAGKKIRCLSRVWSQHRELDVGAGSSKCRELRVDQQVRSLEPETGPS
jgi:hypothetical protein